MISEIKILGQKIPLKTTEKDETLSNEVIALVSKRLEAAEQRLKSQRNAQNVMLLALLDLAEEYVRAKRRTASYQMEMSEKAAEISDEIQEVLKPTRGA